MSRFRTPSRRVMTLLIAAPFVAAACTSAGTDTDPGDAVAAADAVTESGAPGAPTPEPAAEVADWLDIELSDAASGETFTLASLEGDVVAIEPMAIWCTSCRAQQDRVRDVYPEIEQAGIRYISLGIDPGEDPGQLAKYADRRDYGWTFVQSTNEFSRALNDLFGAQILSAPSTPLIVLDASGDVVVQDFGPHRPEDLLALLHEAAA